MHDMLEFLEHVRSRCKRAQSLGRSYKDMQIVVAPSWEEKERLEGKGVLVLHVDEAELFVHEKDLTSEDKSFVSDMMLRFPGIRFLGLEQEGRKQE